jgi:signal peptidase II
MPTTAWLSLAFLAVVWADQVSKAVLCWRVGVDRSVRLGGGVRIRHVSNAEWFFGLRSAKKSLLLLWVVAALCGLVVIEQAPSVGGIGAAVGIAVAVGGATGNLLDRLLRGHVVDFIQIGFWPTFNLADVGIVCGIAVTVTALVV